MPYEGRDGGQRIGALEGLRQKTGWEPITDGPALIGLYDEKGGGAISPEPGGQFELSGRCLPVYIHAVAEEFDRHIADVKDRRADGHGFRHRHESPWTRAETPIMPKQRYGIMMRYMPKVGTRGST